MAPPLPLAFYGDDFTGSADLVLRCRRLGMTGTILLGRPSVDELERAADANDVVGVAGVTRAMPAARIAPIVDDILPALGALDPLVVQYKVCSTADSSPDIGSFGPAIEAGRRAFGAVPVPLLVAQPNLGRYTAFSNHFAVDRGEIHRLDRQEIMANHPVTPMREADLRLHVARQIGGRVEGIHLPVLRDDASLVRAMAEAAQRDAVVAVMDGVEDTDLEATGRLLLDRASDGIAFGIGSAGLSIGLARALGQKPVDEPVSMAPSGKPCLAVAGSCSRLSRDQLHHAIASGWHAIAMDVSLTGAAAADQRRAIADEVRSTLGSGQSTVVHTCGSGPTETAVVDVETLAGDFAALVSDARGAGLIDRALVVGGDTSGHVVTALGARSLHGASVVGDHSTLMFVIGGTGRDVDGLEIVLKGGQIGGVDFFEVVRHGGRGGSL